MRKEKGERGGTRVSVRGRVRGRERERERERQKERDVKGFFGKDVRMQEEAEVTRGMRM